MKAVLSGLIALIVLLRPCTAGVPEGLLKNLASDVFKEREDAEKALVEWAFNHREVAYDELLHHARESEVAEVRVRCLSVLKLLVLDIYESDGEGYVGIRMSDESVRLPGRANIEVALQVSAVMPDSPAEKGGLKERDYIVSLNGEGWKNEPPTEDFRSRIKAIKPKTEVVLKVLRDQEFLEIRVRLARRPSAIDNPFEFPDQTRIDAIEKERREEFFKKWLLERRNDR